MTDEVTDVETPGPAHDLIGMTAQQAAAARYLLTEQRGDGPHTVIEIWHDRDRAEGRRAALEQERPDARFRVYRCVSQLREVSRTVRDGDVRYHVVTVETNFGRDNVPPSPHSWVLPVSQARPPTANGVPSAVHSFADPRLARSDCEVRNALPHGWFRVVSHLGGGTIWWDVKCTHPPCPCGQDGEKFSPRRWKDPAELLAGAEEHVAGLAERQRRHAEAAAGPAGGAR